MQTVKKKKTSHGSTLALVHHFCTSYRHPKQTWPSSRCLVTRSSGETKRGTMSFYPCVIICTSGGNCILCITQGLVCSNLKTGITHTDTVLHCPNQITFLWRSALYSLMFHCHFYHYCYNCTTAYTIYYYYSSLFFDSYGFIMVFKCHLCSERVWYSYEY